MATMFLNNLDWRPLILTLELATCTTVGLLIIGLPLAYALAFSKNKYKVLIEAIIAMPLILPPTVLGFYLLLIFNTNSGIGIWLNKYFGVQLAFSFTGIVLGSIIYSLPFMVQPIQNALQNIPKAYLETSKLLGKSKFETLKKVLLPNIKTSIITAIVLTFAHTIGEFGVVLMIGGSIPNKTKVASIAIYEKVESLDYEGAHQYALVLILLSFIILLSVYVYNRSSVNWSLNFNKK